MPPWYIGSSSVEKVLAGYHGSIKSKKYKSVWNQELTDHPELFKTNILHLHENREEALKEEYSLQKICDVVKSDSYINMSMAAPNGHFGRDVSGKNNPMWGVSSPMKNKQHSEESKKKISVKAMARPPVSEETKKLISLNHNRYFLGRKHSSEHVRKRTQGRIGKKYNVVFKHKPRVECPHCKFIGAINTMGRWHFDNCKTKNLAPCLEAF